MRAQQAEGERIAKDDTLRDWNFKGVHSLQFNQMSFTNWAAGGENTISLAAFVNYTIDYQKDKWRWENIIDLGFGVIQEGENPMRKNEDRIDIVSKLGYKAAKNLQYSFRSNFKTQFAPGYNFPNDSVVVSRFMSPGFLLVSLGMDYKPKPWISIFASPATGKFTFVGDQALADSGAFGVTPAVLGPDGSVLEPGKNARGEFGALVTVQMNKKFDDKINVQSRLDLFNNYTDRVVENRGNIDANWETLVNFHITKWLTTSVFLHLIYDHDIPIPIMEEVNGEEVQIGEGPRTQFKQTFGLALNYTINTFPPDPKKK